MGFSLRAPVQSDWNAILALAHLAVPFDPEGNQGWLENRRKFEGRRHHQVAEDESGAVRGYGAVEEGDLEGTYRTFLVMAPGDLPTVGDLLFERLLSEVTELGASLLWAREYAEDVALRTFLQERGFVERNRFTLPEHMEMVVLTRDLTAD